MCKKILALFKASLVRLCYYNKYRLWILSRRSKLNLIIGAGSVRQKGWIATDKAILDVLDARSWDSLFFPQSITKILSEHVFEHFIEDELCKILGLCYRYLSPNGVLRIAVPDGNRKDALYQEEILPPKDGHKIAFTIALLTRILNENGFKVNALEYFDETGTFHKKDWSDDSGIIRRSSKYDTQTKFKIGDLHYTSIIVDACK